MSRSARALAISRDEDLLGVHQAYLEAVRAGAHELVVELPPGALGLDEPGIPRALSLAAASATEVPDLEVTLRAADGLCVLAGLAVHVSARAVRMENVAVVGGPPVSIDISAIDSLALDDVVVLDTAADEHTGAIVQLQAQGGAGTDTAVRSLVIGHSAGRTAMVNCHCAAGSWFGPLDLDGLVVAGREAQAVLSFESVAELRLRNARMALGGARTLVRALVLPTVAEISGSRLSAGARELLEVVHAFPDRPGEVRLSDSGVTVPLSELPPPLVAGAGVEEIAGATVDAEIAEAIRRATERVVAADGRLEDRLARLQRG